MMEHPTRRSFLSRMAALAGLAGPGRLHAAPGYTPGLPGPGFGDRPLARTGPFGITWEITPTVMEYTRADREGRLWGGWGYDLYRSDDLMRTIHQIASFPQPLIGSYIMKDGTIIVSTDHDRWDPSKDCMIFRSIDGGRSFEHVHTIHGGCAIWWSFAEDDHGNLYAGEYGPKDPGCSKTVWKATGRASTWKRFFTGPDHPKFHVHIVRVDPFTGAVWVINGDGEVRGIQYTADDGATWTRIDHDSQATSMVFTRDSIYFGEDGADGVISRYDRQTGRTEPVFTVKYQGNYGGSVYAMRRGPSGIIYASFVKYAGYIFKSSLWAMKDDTWREIVSFDLDRSVSQGFRYISPPDGHNILYAAYKQGYMFKDPDAPVSVEETTPCHTLRMNTNPNPFNGRTTIAFEVPSAVHRCRIDIHSLSGQKVRTLHLGPRNAGTWNIAWDGRDDGGRTVSSGVYITRLVADRMTGVHKVSLIK